MTPRPCPAPPAAPRGSAMRYLCVALMCVCLFATGWLAGKVYGGSWELPPWLTRLGEMAAYTPGEPLLFNSGLFMLLFVAFTGIHTLCRRRRGLQMAAVIAFSLYFYWKSSATYCFILLGICLTDYGLGLTMGATRSRTMRRALVWANVLINVGMLVYFKYFNLLGQTLASITSTDFDPLDLVLPAGISFFSFRSMSYMVDLYRRRMEPCRSLADYLFFLTFFPPLLAGPVVRAADMLPQIRAGRPATRAMVSEGIFLVICGLVKKVIVADYLAGNFVDRIFDNPALYSGFENLMGVAGFTIQIYCDFSGYSDMAIGLGRAVGFHFPENFKHPYTCTSMTDFWRRWHMSLGSFFRDYVYIPLGGNRRHQALNILTVWFLTGMWHGASWNFIIWGLYFGLIIMLEKYTLLRWKVPRPVLHLYSILLVLIGWGMFYFDDFGRMTQFYKAFFFAGEGSGISMDVESVIMDNLWLWIGALILCLPLRTYAAELADRWTAASPRFGAHVVSLSRAFIVLTLLAVSVALLVGATNNAFIYTRF